jgi:DNA-binding PadR family transcriptional regulator
MFDSGALRLVVLGLIAEESRHGYDIIKALETRFQGAYSPSPGAIYPMLQMMEEADLVVSETQGNKRLYTITDEGRAYLEENRTELDRINAQLDEASGDMQGVALGDAIRDLRRALYRKVRSGEMDADQAKKAVEILKKARDDLDQLYCDRHNANRGLPVSPVSRYCFCPIRNQWRRAWPNRQSRSRPRTVWQRQGCSCLPVLPGPASSCSWTSTGQGRRSTRWPSG